MEYQNHIAILGSTGSIGTQTLEVVRQNKDIRVWGISGYKNLALLEKQALEFSPVLVGVGTKEDALLLQEKLGDTKVVYGKEGLLEIAALPQTKTVVTALVGMAGIAPTVKAIEAGKDIALANKETLVCAGSIIMNLAREKNVRIYPVDSEHSAIFQCLQGNEGNPIKKILLTASGGPFRGYDADQLQRVTLAEALKHPNWSMGKKITVDSSTMVNKGLEVMEATHLFGVDMDQIQVVVHPESIVHSMVEFEDGALMAQLGTPDMRLPISYALYYPKRRGLQAPALDIFQIGALHFEKPDLRVFRGLYLAIEAGKKGGSAPVVFNAANENSVDLFLKEKISYRDIVTRIERAVNSHTFIENPSLEEIQEFQNWTEQFLKEKDI